MDELFGEIDAIRESASEPSEGVIENAAASGTLVDSDGTKFDSSIHATNASGEPSITARGKFRKRKGLGQSRVANVQADQQKRLQDKEQREQSRALGEKAADLFMGSCVMLGGDDWTPQGAEDFKADIAVNEYNMMRKAFADAAEAGDWKVSPNTFLALAMLGYTAPRLVGSKETHKRIGWFARNMKPKIRAAGAWFKGFRKGRKNAAHSDSRNERVGENDASKDDLRAEPESGTRDGRT